MRTPFFTRSSCWKRPTGRWWLALAVLAMGPALGLAADPPRAASAMVGVPDAAIVAVTWMGGGTSGEENRAFAASDAWVDVVFSIVDDVAVPVESSWRSACAVANQLVPDRGVRMHACGPGGRDWVQVVGWEDPIAVEQGLRRLGTQAMGSGRFRLPVAGLEVVVREGWIVLAPRDSPWIDVVVLDLEGGSGVIPGWQRDVDSAFRVMFRHASPVSGISRLVVHPTSSREARFELQGDYVASPLPIRPASLLDRQDVERLQGRFSLVVQESGIGLLDPMIIEFAAAHPELVPPAELRRCFAANRIVVLDGIPVEVSGVGLVDVPAIGIVVPLRDGEASPGIPEVEAMVDDWIGSAGLAVRAGFDSTCVEGVAVTREGGIRYLPLGRGLLEAANRHPMALAGELGWTVRMDEFQDRGWLVVGSSVRHVRSIADRLVASGAVIEPPDVTQAERCMQVVLDPGRLAGGVRDLARIRSAGDDADATVDAEVLDRLVTILSGFERFELVSQVQAEDRIEASVLVRRRLAPSTLGDVATTRTKSP